MKSFLNYLNESILLEDKEGKNINRAEKWIKENHPEVIGKKLQDGTTITPRILTQEIRNTIPNVRMCDCKFLVGAIRFYFDGQNNPNEMQNQMNKLNKILKILCTAHADEYDNNFNGISFDELDKKFSSAVQRELDSDKEEIDKLNLIKKDDYEIIPIDSFEDASKYGQYTSWCVTHHENMYQSYTKSGLGRFYFCLKPGFEKVEEIEGEDCPMDDYGKSMIAISVNDDGSLNTCTCRWNHDNGGNDNMMDTKQISEFFGVNFYKTFLPRSVKDIWQKYEKMRDKDDEFCKFFDCIKIYDEDNGNYNYKKLIDDKIQTLIRVDDKTTFIDNKFVTLKDGKFVEGRPTSIGHYVFSYCESLTSITIPDSVTSIGERAFRGCDSLTSITIPDSVTSIGDMVFYGCDSLQNIYVKGDIEKVEKVFKENNENKIHLLKPYGVEFYIKDDVLKKYYGNDSEVVIPDNVTSIGNRAFIYCKSLTSITIPDSVTSIGNSTFYGCKSLKEISIPDSVTSIDNFAFYGCKSLKEITIPDSVTSIGNYTFYNCESLKEITIPDSVTSIGEQAFYNCQSLTSIYVKGDIEKVGKAFEKNNKDKIYLLKLLIVNEGINNYIYYWARLIKEN